MRKDIAFTDFPLDEIRFYFTDNTILLPSEVLAAHHRAHSDARPPYDQPQQLWRLHELHRNLHHAAATDRNPQAAKIPAQCPLGIEEMKASIWRTA